MSRWRLTTCLLDFADWLRWLSAEDAWWYIRRPFAVLRRLPLVKCPACGGAGGDISGYYEREWCECKVCYPQWVALVHDWNLSWAEGRISPLFWPWAKLRGATPHWTLRGWVTCRLGRHRPDPDGWCCTRCYESLDPPHGERS